MSTDNNEKPRVRVEHYRYTEDDEFRRYFRGYGFRFGNRFPEDVRKVPPVVKGGMTLVHIDLSNMELSPLDVSVKEVHLSGIAGVVVARAICSMRDSFNYKLGRTIALGRLHKQLEHWGLADQVEWPPQ